MNTQQFPNDHGGNNGPLTHADTNSDEQHTMSEPEPDAEPALDAADAHQDLLAVTDQVAPNWYADKVAHPLGTAEHRPALDPAEPQPHPDTHPAADRRPAELSRKQFAELAAAYWRATVSARDALDILSGALLDALVAVRKLSALVGQLPDLRDSEFAESANDPGAGGGGEPAEPAGWDWGAGRD